MNAKTRNGICHTPVSSRFSSLLTAHSALFTSFAPFSPATPISPPPVRPIGSFRDFPQKANSLQPVAMPVMSVPAGTYTATQNVTISSTTAGASIRYTTDGSTPTSAVGTVYTAPVSVGVSQTLKAIAYQSGMTDSPVASAAYTINLPTYAVSYDANGSDSGTAPATQSKTQGIALTLAGNSGALAKTGYTFSGWNTAAYGNGSDYAVSASYTTDAALTLFAKWIPLPTDLATGLAADGSQDLLTPAGDGVKNLLKFAFNMIGSGAGQGATLATPNSAVLAPDGFAGLPSAAVNGSGKLGSHLHPPEVCRHSRSRHQLCRRVQRRAGKLGCERFRHRERRLHRRHLRARHLRARHRDRLCKPGQPLRPGESHRAVKPFHVP